MDTSYQSVVKRLKLFPKIFVTGPQRSGTMVVSAALAHDLDYYFYPEEQVRVWEWWRVERLWRRTSEFVLQTPALCRYAHKVPDPEETAVVLARRNIDDIIASEGRINWDGHARELRQYGLREGVISVVKYHFWDSYQKHVIPNAFEVDYKSLADHPLWVPKELRKDFEPRQYRLHHRQIPT